MVVSISEETLYYRRAVRPGHGWDWWKKVLCSCECRIEGLFPFLFYNFIFFIFLCHFMCIWYWSLKTSSDCDSLGLLLQTYWGSPLESWSVQGNRGRMNVMWLRRLSVCRTWAGARCSVALGWVFWVAWWWWCWWKWWCLWEWKFESGWRWNVWEWVFDRSKAKVWVRWGFLVVEVKAKIETFELVLGLQDFL